jgi:C4-dicarboxylate-binding protein DctP
LKIRIPPMPGLIALCEALGIENVTVSSTEVVTALETGMVEGLQTPIMTLKKYGLIELTPYVTRCNSSFTGATFVVNAKFWNSLPADLQGILQQVLEEYGQKRHQIGSGAAEGLWKEYEAAPSTTVTILSPEEKAKWVDAARPGWEVLKAQSDEHRMVIEAIDAIR